MELLEGDTLKMRLNEYRARGKRMPLGEMLRVTTDILEGLNYAHSEGIVHRDIKPANVLLTKRGQAVVTDFGIAQIVGGTNYTISGALMGTLAYMAPEQGLQGTTSVQSDIYSLGIVFYEMLTGRPPFDADTPLAILMKHVNDPLPLPRSIDETIPDILEQIILKALAKHPEDRFQSAGEMIQALREAADQLDATLPEHISDPDFTAVGTPAGVAVLSGADRERVTDVPLVSDETDIDIQVDESIEYDDETLHDKAAVTQKGAEAAFQPRISESFLTFDPSELLGPKHKSKEAAKAILITAVVLIGYNLVAIMLALFSGNWGIYNKGWTIQILLITFGLIQVMTAIEAPIMMIPVGLIGGMGLLLSFYSLIGAWSLWSVLWPLVPLLVLGTVIYTLWLGARGERKTELIHLTARRLSQVIMVASVIVVSLSFVF
jgi:hypothetical protein